LEGVHQAVSLADAKCSDVARVLGTSSRLLKEGRARFWAFIEGKVKDLVEFRGKMRSDKFPEEWAEFIVETWCSDRCTRASERSSDEMRNPNTKKDPEWYRLHFLEKKILTGGGRQQGEASAGREQPHPARGSTRDVVLS
jgi:hypothetical protein